MEQKVTFQKPNSYVCFLFCFSLGFWSFIYTLFKAIRLLLGARTRKSLSE